MRRGHAVRETLRSLRFELDDQELLIGRMAGLTCPENERREANEYLAAFQEPGGRRAPVAAVGQRLAQF